MASNRFSLMNTPLRSRVWPVLDWLLEYCAHTHRLCLFVSRQEFPLRFSSEIPQHFGVVFQPDWGTLSIYNAVSFAVLEIPQNERSGEEGMP